MVMIFCLKKITIVTWGLMSLWQMPFEWMYARDLWVNTFHTCPNDLHNQPEELVHVELDEGDRDGLLLLAVLSRHLTDNIDQNTLQNAIGCNFGLCD